MTPRAAALTAALALATLAGSGSAADAVELRSVPHPDLGSMEPAVRRQLGKARATLDELLGVPDPPAAELGELFGTLGRLYFRYELRAAAEACFANAAALDSSAHHWHYYLAMVAGDRGDAQQAVDSLLRAHALLPDDLPTLLRLGSNEVERNRLQDAAEWFRRALTVDPGSAKALQGLAQVAELQGELAAAADLYERALAAQPAADSLRYALGMVYRRLGEGDRARAHLQAYGAGPVTFADPLADQLTELAAGAGIHLVRGNLAFSRGLYEIAEEHYRSALSVDPANRRAQRALASALARKGDTDAALGAYEGILAEAPEDAVAHYNVGLLHLRRGDFQTAITHFSSALESAPDDVDTLYNLAAALQRSGDVEQAARVAGRAVAAAPEDGAARLLSARLKLASGERDIGEAELEALFATRPDIAEAAILLASFDLERGDLDSAIGRLEQTVAAGARHADAYVQLATLLGRAGRLDEAAAEFGSAIELDPTREDAHFGRAMATLLAGDDARAQTGLEEALRALPDSLPLRHLLARLLATSDDPIVRRGDRALALASSVFDDEPSIDHAETVAMALAELGRFRQAAEWQRRCIDRARTLGLGERVPRLESRLVLYERGKTVRRPWLSGE